MSSSEAVNQESDISPPRRGQGCAITIDSTARAYDLSPLSWNKVVFLPLRNVSLFLDLVNDGASALYFYFSPDNTVTLDETVTIAAGGALALDGRVPQILPSGQRLSVRITRPDDLFLVAKTTAATTTLRIFPSSESTPTGPTR